MATAFVNNTDLNGSDLKMAVVQLQTWKSAQSLLRDLNKFDNQTNYRCDCKWVTCTLPNETSGDDVSIAEYTQSKLGYKNCECPPKS